MARLASWTVLTFVGGACAGTILFRAIPARGSPDASLRYEFLRGGQVVGHQISTANDSNTTVRFEGDDAGRHWSFHETAQLDAAGIPISITVSGHDAAGRTVTDEFRRDGRTATWRNDGDSGSAQSAHPFYLTMPVLEGQVAAVPDELGRLARALLAARGGPLSLAPAGAATLRRIGQTTVTGRGGVKALVHYEINGLDYAPFQIWLEPDGALFAAFTAGTIVREGWSDVVPSLLVQQRAALRDHVTSLATQIVHARSAPFAFVHARVFDARTATAREHMTVIVKGRTIEAVAPDAAVTVTKETERIDASGATLIPGLWDMHTHLTPIDGLLHVSAGVTTVRDLGNDVDQVLAMQRDFAENRAVGPRVLLAGLIDGRGPYQGPTKLLVDSEEEARSVIDLLARDGFAQVKIYGSLKASLVPYIARLAHERGLRVGGHVPAFMTARQAVEAGFDEVNHINYMFLNFMPDVKHLESPERVTATADGAAGIDLGSEPVREFLDFLKAHGTVIDPTLSTWETRLLARAGQIDPAVAPVFDRLPVRPRRAALRAGLPAAPDQVPRYKDGFAAMLRMDHMLYERGVKLVTGSDGLARFGFDRELELEVEAGVPAQRVLKMATFDAAQLMHLDNEVGTIGPGKVADLILVPGAPDIHIGDLRAARIVVKGGVVFRVDELDHALALMKNMGERR